MCRAGPYFGSRSNWWRRVVVSMVVAGMWVALETIGLCKGLFGFVVGQ